MSEGTCRAAIEFDSAFQSLTGNPPFPWQRALYQRLTGGDIPVSCNLPTGMGKTSVIAVWLIALANGLDVPRRLVYVVNRRTVVDQTTEEVKQYKGRQVVGIPDFAVSTLRGQFADNREWSKDPSRPAVICGTVDMIGSRLLFSGYGVGTKARPLHAGFLGQDSLLVHDEAHLEPAFQTLVEAICEEQARCRDIRPLRVMELTATSRGKGQPFGLSDEDRKHSIVAERLTARKAIHLEPLKDARKQAEQLATRALKFEDRARAVLVFARTVDDVLKVAGKLPKDRVVTLTGTMRGKERDELVGHLNFRRFLPGGQSDEPTTYLVCTAAGEVGVNISADHLICDLTPFDSMAQRFGRVNRFGRRLDTEIHVVHPVEFKNDEYDRRRQITLALLRDLDGDGSPDAIGRLDPERRQQAFTPTPVILPATDILFDAWALTSIRDTLPGRPPVEPYLHGLPTDWQPPETHVAWRKEVETVTGELLREYEPADLLDVYPLKPHELLKEPSHRAFERFEVMARRLAGRSLPVWLLDDSGRVECTSIEELARKDRKDRIVGKTVLLPPSAGGLAAGMLNGESNIADDVADTAERVRVWSDDSQYDVKTTGMHSIFTIAFPADDEGAEERTWQWFAAPHQGELSARKPVLWSVHVGDVVKRATEIVAGLPLDQPVKDAIITSAELHDHGKRRKLFQQVVGNAKYPARLLAKSGKNGGRLKETYRHEFGSLLDVAETVSADYRDLILHLIAAHHGRGRPHFPSDEAFDPERSRTEADAMAAEVPRRFGRLQRKYGRWGLAYLESLLRAADWAASANPTAFVEDEG
ncbi:MAG: type I-U CRISPR-associated helicase/endonuclease Cas3 [Acidobacteria bacterium]|nr:type I-U CRISPR-associated helicase/endonuclease Cas3 [Acidobacteriota bacterium]